MRPVSEVVDNDEPSDIRAHPPLPAGVDAVVIDNENVGAEAPSTQRPERLIGVDLPRHTEPVLVLRPIRAGRIRRRDGRKRANVNPFRRDELSQVPQLRTRHPEHGGALVPEGLRQRQAAPHVTRSDRQTPVDSKEHTRFHSGVPLLESQLSFANSHTTLCRVGDAVLGALTQFA